MATSVHIPKPLLDALDRRARALRTSRNRLIVRALQNELARATHWSEGFFERLAQVQPGDADTVDHVLKAVRAARRSKKPPRL